ncbi:MAG: 50S ribosomal protein L18 [Flavobacteriales bacterium]|nr:50S ribosomal protein L18 [Flavobacteriales bacterium]
MALSKFDKRTRIKRRIRKKISGTTETPRLSVFRSNKEIYAQIVNDLNGETLAAATSLGDKAAQKVNKVEQATLVGKKIAEVAKAAGVEKVVFDRNGYQYHGRVQALAEAARENGLKF